MRTTLNPPIVPVKTEAAYDPGMPQPVISPAQVRMARAALRLGIRQLAEKSGISGATIVRVEREAVTPTLGTMVTLRSTFEGLGVEFLDEEGTVRFLRPSKGGKP